MNWETFLNKTQHLPVIDTALFKMEKEDWRQIVIQIGRWEAAKKLIKLRRGLYLLALPYRKVKVDEFYLASVIKWPSYVSLESALHFHGMIPEGVSTTTSLTSKRAAKFQSEEGIFDYRTIKTDFFWGYDSVTNNNMTSYIAYAEKALLDLFYVKKLPASFDCLEELRLQNLGMINQVQLREYAKKFNKPKMIKAADLIIDLAANHVGDMKTL